MTAGPGSCWSDPIWYRGWRIYGAESPPRGWAPDFEFAYVHDSYDGAPIEPDGPPADARCGFAASIEDAKSEIDQYENEEAHGRAREWAQ